MKPQTIAALREFCNEVTIAIARREYGKDVCVDDMIKKQEVLDTALDQEAVE